MRRLAYLAVLAVACRGAATRSWTIETVAGSDNVGDNGPAAAASLAGVESVAVDAWGNAWLADTAGNRVRKVTPQGIITTVAGGGPAGDGGPSLPASLASPYGVAADRAGNVFIAELASGRVRRIGPDGVISSLGAKFTAPRNLAVDAAGNLFVSDFSDSRVYRVATDRSVSLFAGGVAAGFSGDGGPATLASLRNPCGLAVDNTGAVYIADSGNHRIRKVSQGIITTVTGGPGVIASPTGVAVDPSGAIYIAESANNRVLKWNGVLSVALRDIPVRDVALDGFNNLYIAAGERVWRMQASGRLELLAGDGAYGFRGDGGPALDARLASPYGVALDAAGTVLFSDQTNHRVRGVTRAGIISTLAGPAGLGATAGVAATPSGDILVADFTGNKVWRVAPGGAPAVLAGTGRAGIQGDGGPAARGELNQPVGVAADAYGTVYIADSGNHRIRSVTRDGYLITIAGTGVKGYSGDGGSAMNAQFDTPKGVAVDAAGNLYVADTGNHAVRRITPQGTVRTIAGTGVAGPSPDSLDGPVSVAVDTAGSVYIADAGNHRVLALAPDGTVEVAAGTGHAGFSGDGGPAASATLDTPAGLAADGDGAVWIADHRNRRIRKLTPVTAAPPPVVIPPAESQAPLAVLHAATLKEGAVAPGQIVIVEGKGFREGDTQIVFDRYVARLLNVDPEQVTALVPREVAGSGSVEVRALAAGSVIGTATVTVAASAVGIFTAGDGSGQAAALNEDGSYNSAANPAARGSVIVFYATGTGIETLPVSASAGGYPAEVEWYGQAPGFPGLMQVNLRLPGGFLPGGALPLVLKVGGSESQSGVTIAVR